RLRSYFLSSRHRNYVIIASGMNRSGPVTFISRRVTREESLPLFRALSEFFLGRTKRTFARRETDVDRLRLGYKPQKFYPPTENIREAIGGERDTAASFDRTNNAIH